MSSKKTKKVKNINHKTLIVTFDIGKNIHYGYFRAPNNKEIKPFQVYNSGHSFNKLWSKICHFQKQQELKEVVVGFEPTGLYAEPLVHFFRKKPVRLVQVNPMHTKRLKELTGNSPNKTDKKDPRVIADVISLGHALTLVIPEGAAAELRRLTQARERSIQKRTAIKNQLQHLIYILFPEFLEIMKNISTKSAIYLINNYPTPESIINLGLDSLTLALKKVSRGKLGQERAKKLFEAAQSSVGINEGKRSIVLEIKYLVTDIKNHNQFIDEFEKHMAEYLDQIPYSQNILSIKGMGEITVAGLIDEVADFREFNTISEIMKLAGLDLYEVSSGKHKGCHHISKRGRPLMRKLLYFAAINMVKSEGIMHKRYQNMLNQGMPKIKALTAISRKILRIIFALTRDNTMYDKNYNEITNFKKAA